MKVLFAIPENKSLFGDEGMTAHPHIGIAYLTAFLKRKGIGVSIFDNGIEKNADKVISLIDEYRPDIIGVTIFSYCYAAAYNLIKKIRRRKNIPLVLGGPHVGAIKRRILQDTEADFAIKSEGEFTLSELIDTLKSSTWDFSKIEGLIWRKNGEVIENNDRPYICDLDEIPFPDYEAFQITKYVCCRQKTLPLITSRGCPFGCNYCSVRLSMGQGFRPRSARNVYEEIKLLYGQGWNSFDINDDCFTLDKERAEHICDLIIENKLRIRFQLYNGIRVDTVDSNLLKKMKRAGCYFISYGCEAGTNNVLKAIKKGITLQQVRDAVDWTNSAGINNSVNFIIGHKEETYQDALETIRFADSLPTNFVNFYNLLPYPGTESFEWARQHARFLVPPDSFLENISYRDNKPVFETDEFRKDQRQQVVALGFDLYRKKILIFRLGKVLGNLVYWVTKNSSLNRFASTFALNNPIGRFIYIKLSRKSYVTKEGEVFRVDWISEVENRFSHPAIVLWRAIELKHIKEVLNKRVLNEPILDLGCAEGKIAGLLFNGGKLIGLDNSWELLSQNRENETYRELVFADACYLPFKDGFFSSVFSNCVIEHIPNIKGVLQEVCRVLKPRGVFLFTVPSDKFGDYLFFTAIFNNLGLKSISNWYKNKRNALLKHFHCYNHNRWTELLDKKDFDLIEYNYYMPRKAAIFWDFLAFLILILRSARLLNLVQPKLNRYLKNYLKKYYNMESVTGAGLLIVAQKRSA